MTTTDPIPRILLVENEEPTISNLTYKLERDIPGVVIVTARTSHAARVEQGRAVVDQSPFDVALLDLRLPKDHSDGGESPDYQLPSLFQALDGLVIQITAKADDVVFARARPDPESPDAKRHLFFEKIDNSDQVWTQAVVDAAAGFIREKHARRIRSNYERLFPSQEGAEVGPVLTGRPSTGGDDSDRGREIARFCDDAGDHWDLLDEALRAKLEETLGHVQDADGRHYVGVLTEGESRSPIPREKKP